MGMERAKQYCNGQNYKEFMLSFAGTLPCVQSLTHEYVSRSQPCWAWMRKHKGAGAVSGVCFFRAWLTLIERWLAAYLSGWRRGDEQHGCVLQAKPLHSLLRRNEILSYFSSILLSGGFVLPFLSTRSWLSPVLLKAPFFMNANKRGFHKLKFDLRLLIFWKKSLLQWVGLY